tara:strand:+ start:216 stop:428 length:213 start_codon:yes stop_codon:yes gene_type:complete
MVKYKVYVRYNIEHRMYVTAENEEEAQKKINNIKKQYEKFLVIENTEKIIESESHTIEVQELKDDEDSYI